MRGLKLFIYYLILITAGLLGYFFGCEGSAFFSMFDLFLLGLLCIFVLSKLQEMYEFVVIRALLEIIKLYVYLLICVFVVYWVLVSNEWLWYIVVILFLWGVYLDHKIIGWRYLVFSVFVLLHVIVIWNGWMNTEILIIRDIFWYSLIMLGGFIWHVLILNWLSKLMCYLDLDYGKYVISRWSLLTSLTLIWLILQWCLMIIRYFCEFTSFKNYYNFFISKQDIFLFCYSIIFLIFLVVQYFCIVFNNYSYLLLGLGDKINILDIPIKVYIFIIVTFIMSIWLYVPRIYIIWIIMFSMNIGLFAKRTIIYLKYSLEFKVNGGFIGDLLWNCWIEDFFFDKYRDIRLIRINNFSWKGDRYWKGFVDLYEVDLFRDYIWFIKEQKWGIDSESIKGVYDIFEVFIYSEDREARILSKILRGYTALYSGYFYRKDIEYNKEIVKSIWEDLVNLNPYFSKYEFEDIIKHMPVDDLYYWVRYVNPSSFYRQLKSASFIFWVENRNKIFD